jgi:outer membrane protein TolC
VGAGIAFRGDLLRVLVQVEKGQVVLRQAEEHQQLAVTKLAQLLHLPPGIALAAREEDFVPLAFVETNAALPALIVEALETRLEIKENRVQVEAARELRNGTRYGALVPSLGAQIFAGGLGGGKRGDPSEFGESEDYQFTLNWRIGPGGLFDRGRIRASESRLRLARFNETKWVDEIRRQVVDGHTRVQSLAAQLGLLRRTTEAAEEALRLARSRKEFAVGAVLETIQTEQELTRARLDYAIGLAEFNKAQLELNRAVGRSSRFWP